jgi:hypothetical protein
VRQTAAVMTQVMHVPMSPAMVTKTQDQVSRALAAPVEEVSRAGESDRVWVGHSDPVIGLAAEAEIGPVAVARPGRRIGSGC